MIRFFIIINYACGRLCSISKQIDLICYLFQLGVRPSNGTRRKSRAPQLSQMRAVLRKFAQYALLCRSLILHLSVNSRLIAKQKVTLKRSIIPNETNLRCITYIFACVLSHERCDPPEFSYFFLYNSSTRPAISQFSDLL